ncbi:carbohydrate ABC transporter permease [Frondihabitans sp. PAMC 28766]|uniref:carbohydrate ABC transporter permease n=1 Tax=Frondihabitans sp. PAMC 28766 TaxID=1795630 RepID=UPI001EF4D99D|nr:sugar ABC transporter permease [Frondihabitans sp. PAMC 28766]
MTATTTRQAALGHDGPPVHHRATSYQRSAWAFLGPGAAVVVLVLYLPVLYTVYLSFTTYSGLGSPVLAGVANYVALFQDPVFLTSLVNTLIWVAGSLLIPVGIGLVVAYLSFGLKGAAWLRVPFLIPYALSGVAVGIVFSFVLQNGGALSQALAFLHLPGAGTRWLEEAPLNTIVMILAASWQGIGVNALLFTVGLQSIPKEPSRRRASTEPRAGSCSASWCGLCCGPRRRSSSACPSSTV